MNADEIGYYSVVDALCWTYWVLAERGIRSIFPFRNAPAALCSCQSKFEQKYCTDPIPSAEILDAYSRCSSVHQGVLAPGLDNLERMEFSPCINSFMFTSKAEGSFQPRCAPCRVWSQGWVLPTPTVPTEPCSDDNRKWLCRALPFSRDVLNACCSKDMWILLAHCRIKPSIFKTHSGAANS